MTTFSEAFGAVYAAPLLFSEKMDDVEQTLTYSAIFNLFHCCAHMSPHILRRCAEDIEELIRYEERIGPTDEAPTPGDVVNHPAHYTSEDGSIEAITIIENVCGLTDGENAFSAGNALKYLLRWKKKNGVTDLQKAYWYVRRLIQKLDEKRATESSDA